MRSADVVIQNDTNRVADHGEREKKSDLLLGEADGVEIQARMTERNP
jgi:hypothetical protein